MNAQRPKRAWASGWPITHKVPRDPGHDGARQKKAEREADLRGQVGRSDEERAAHADKRRAKRQVQRTARKAGYIARHWPKNEKNRYTGGPAEGLHAVDPWIVSEKLGECSKNWESPLWHHQDRGVTVKPIARMCHQGHVCPICASQESGHRSEVVTRAIMEALREDPSLKIAHVTLTQRNKQGETLQAAMQRFRRSWDLISKGRPGRALRSFVAGWYSGDEVTLTWAGKAKRAKQPERQASTWWHYHRHMIVLYRPGAQEWILDQWLRATGRVDIDGRGRADVAAYKNGKWWREIPRDLDAPDLQSEIHQAVKYAAVAATFPSVRLAEYLAVAYRRRWHGAGGVLYGVMGQIAADLRMEKELRDGKMISRPGPRAPRLDQVAPDWGWPTTAHQIPRGMIVTKNTLTKIRALPGWTGDHHPERRAVGLDRTQTIDWVLLDAPDQKIIQDLADRGWTVSRRVVEGVGRLSPLPTDDPDQWGIQWVATATVADARAAIDGWRPMEQILIPASRGPDGFDDAEAAEYLGELRDPDPLDLDRIPY